MNSRSVVLVLCLTFALYGGGRARAQEDTDEIEGLSCVTKKGSWAIHLSVYQGREAAGKEWATYCRDIPQLGKTILVFDLLYQKMRAMPVAVRIVEVIENAEPKTFLTVSAQTYPSGVITIETAFEKPGHYTALVDVDDDGRPNPGTDTLSFPLSVATHNTMTTFGLLAPWLIVAVFSILGVMAYRYFGRSS